MNSLDLIALSNIFGLFIFLFLMYKLFKYLKSKYNLLTALLTIIILSSIISNSANEINNKDEIKQIVNKFLIEKKIIKADETLSPKDIRTHKFKPYLFESAEIVYNYNKLQNSIEILHFTTTGINVNMKWADADEIMIYNTYKDKNTAEFTLIIEYRTTIFGLYQYSNEIKTKILVK